MKRKDFANMTAIVTKRGAEWTQELICTGDLSADQKPETIRRFCRAIRDVLADIEAQAGISP